MTTRTALVVQAELDIINGALQSIYEGKQLSELRIDTNILRRYYKYTPISETSLLAQKTKLEQELLILAGETPTFRSFGNIPMVVTKQGIY
jgi:hypothetical protein